MTLVRYVWYAVHKTERSSSLNRQKKKGKERKSREHAMYSHFI